MLERLPKRNFTPRSSTKLRGLDFIPHRMDIAGGFFDQKKLNASVTGAAIICNIEPKQLADRAGMSSSTRKVIRELFGNRLPKSHGEKELANIILAYENFDQEYISGQPMRTTHLLAFADSNSTILPSVVEKIRQEILNWLEQHLFLHFTHARPEGTKCSMGGVIHNDVLGIYALTSDKTGNGRDIDLSNLIKCVKRTCEIQKQLIHGYVSDTVSASWPK